MPWRAVSEFWGNLMSFLTFSVMIEVFKLVCIIFVIFIHRRRIYTEEKVKVVASSLGTEFLQFFAALTILDDLKNRLICTGTTKCYNYM